MTLYHFILLLLPLSCSSFLVDITVDVFSDPLNNIIAAYGDFDADKLTDIFVISDHGSTVGVFLQLEDDGFNYHELFNISNTDKIISGVMPADFDHDAQMDLLLTLVNNEDDIENRPVTVQVHWGKGKHGLKGHYEFPESLRDQPLIFDWNSNMIPDILGETEAGERYVYSYVDDGKENPFKKTAWPNETVASFRYPTSNAFVDLNADYLTDLSLMVEKSDETQFEQWYSKNGTFVHSVSNDVSFPRTFDYVGQSSFLDFNQDGIMSMLVPVCEDDVCEKSAIWIYQESSNTKGNSKWFKVEIDSLKHDDKVYQFIPPQKSQAKDVHQYMPVTLHIGDLNMDGYPDVLTVMGRKDGDSDKMVQEAVLMFNEACNDCNNVKRKLVPQWNTHLQSLSGVILASFFDIHENGILDILTVSMTKDKNGDQVPALRAYRNDFDADACFVKITVVSGLCNTECEDGRPPYGVNQPGPVVAYRTQQMLGVDQQSSASQLSQSAHFATQLPYTIFGLGQTPNFVDQLTVGIPTPPDQHQRKRTWTQIIPNSQLIVIPYPNDEPSRWTMKLFLTPSKQIYITGFALLGTCIVCGIIVAVLHLLEKQEDKVEKQQESQKFHFDAM